MDEANYIVCNQCRLIVHYTPANTVIFYFRDAPWYSVAQTVCANCDNRQGHILYPKLEWEVEWAEKHDLGFVHIDGIPDKYEHVYDAFHSYHPEVPRFHNLGDGEEKEVLFFAWLMDHDPIERWFDD